MAEGLPTLGEALEAEAALLDGVERTAVPTGTEWRLGATLFAVLDGKGVEFRLAPPVAAAALHTPDTVTSARGHGWVAFRPATADRHALDRAVAWLASAWRRVSAEG